MSGQAGELSHVLDGINEAQKVGFNDIKINVVIQKGVNDHNVLDMVKHFKNTPQVLRFIEYMDVGNCNHWESKYVVPSSEIVNTINQHYPIEPAGRQYFGEVASRYKFCDGQGEIGFISSVSQPFCRDCTRVRLSADGQIFTCLFAQNGHDVRSLMRNGADDQTILSHIQSVWQNREDRYSELRSKIPSKEKPRKVEMYHIGG